MQHVACMMDGNRRWARRQGWQAYKGHKEGLGSLKHVINFCLERSIPYLSLYTLSAENLKRSEEEKTYLFNLIAEVLSDEKTISELIRQGVRVRFIGERELFPANLVALCTRVEQATEHLTTLQVNFLFCYGSRQEILSGVKEIARKVKNGDLALEDISHEQFQRCLWMGDIPEPDIVIRTGDVMRLSNFLLYQSAYSEFYFLSCMWPELTRQHLEDIYHNFMEQRERRFGV